MNATGTSPDTRRDADPTVSYRARIRAAESADNPLLEAARPLLDALADMPAALDVAGVAHHRQWLVQQLRMFGKICGELRLPQEHAEQARYCLCSALDEAAGRSDWGNGSQPGMDWSATALVTVFGYDRQGGDRVYAIATEALHTPHENRHLIAVIQQILERGFKGRYRFANDSAQRIAAIQQQIEQAVTADIPRIALPAESVRAAEPPAESAPATVEIHPVDQVTTQTPPPPNTRLESRRWPVAALFGLLLIAAAAAIGYSWHTPIVPPSPATSTPAPSGALAARLTDRLASDLSTGTVSLVENAGHTTVTLRLEGIFEAGQSNIDPRIKSMISRIGQEIAQTPCTVLVTGHTDDQPFAQTEHSSNLTLSDARALEVVQILVSAGVTPARIHSTGKGNAEPAADNSTAQGRKRNRRVEITVTE